MAKYGGADKEAKWCLGFLDVGRTVQPSQSVPVALAVRCALRCLAGQLVVMPLVLHELLAGQGSAVRWSCATVEACHLPGHASHLVALALLLLVDDALFNAMHRAAHRSRALFRWFHALHHMCRAPSGMFAMLAHPSELTPSLAAIGVFRPLHPFRYYSLLPVLSVTLPHSSTYSQLTPLLHRRLPAAPVQRHLRCKLYKVFTHNN